ITERKKSEEALRESEERYRNLVRNAPAGIYEIDLNTKKFIEVNEFMCQILGYTRQELLSMNPEDMLDKEGRNRFTERMSRALEGKDILPQAEYKVKTNDGGGIWAVFRTSVNY